MIQPKKKCYSDAIISQFNLQILIELRVAKNYPYQVYASYRKPKI